ncbi:MAG: ABC transporter permease [Planctomycetota bacterium]|nr:ABC transporter permease [Planctomycetota bacterium]
MFSFVLDTIRLGLNNLRLHKLRALLTALGIILGVAAVITMNSLGEGAKREALAQIERLGARNIIIRSQKPPETQQQSGGSQRASFVSRFGITREDFEVINDNFPDATVVPLKEVGSQILRNERRQTSQAYGTTPELIRAANLTLARGRYLTDADLREQTLVAVIGAEVAKEFFPLEDPLGATLRIDSKSFTVVGILNPVGLAGGAGASLVGRDLNLDIHVPITTANSVFGDLVFRRTQGSFSGNAVQIAEIFLVVPDRERVIADAARARRIFEVRHPGLTDIGIIVPFELLEQARKSALTYNLVVGFIAGISLLVGGIGIMNIMLATVTERTREIGIRRAVGATRRDILLQFLVETSTLSSAGGLIGVVLGVGLSVSLPSIVALLPRLPYLRTVLAPDLQLPTQVTLYAVVLAFVVAAGIGLVFGLYPARMAAKKDPIEALRHD